MADLRRSTAPPAHDEHEVEVVVELATAPAGSVAGPDLERAEALIASCDACATLARDLRGMADAMTALPVPERPRDFRLSEADVARLRPSAGRRVLTFLRRPRFNVGQPVAASLTMLGLAGLLVTTLPVGGGGPTAETGAAGQAPAVASGAPAPDNVPLEASPAAGNGAEGAPAAGGGAAGATPAPEVDAGGQPQPTKAAAGAAAESSVPRELSGDQGVGRIQELPGTTPVPVPGVPAAEVAPGPDGPRIALALASAGLAAGGLALLLANRRRAARH